MASEHPQQHHEALRQSALKGNFDEVKARIQAGADINTQDPGSQTTPLMYAAGQGKLKVVNYLIRQGAERNKCDNSGKTALFHAVSGESVKVVKSLLRAGDHPEVTDQQGWTPLMHACDGNQLSIVRCLIQHGAKPNHVDERGENALSLAQRWKNQHMVALLKAAGAREREVRLRKPMEPLLSVFSCDICLYLPDYTEVEEDSAIERNLTRFEPIHSQAEDLGRHAYCSYVLRKCPNCATLYLYFSSYDAEDSHVSEPCSSVEIWRLNLNYAKQLLSTLEKTSEADALHARYPSLIDEINQRMKHGIHRNFFTYMVDSLVDYSIATTDWKTLHQDLIRHPSPTVGLSVLNGLIHLLGEEPTTQGIPISRYSRPITRATKAQSNPFIQQHLPEILAEIDRFQTVEDWKLQSTYSWILRAIAHYGLA